MLEMRSYLSFLGVLSAALASACAPSTSTTDTESDHEIQTAPATANQQSVADSSAEERDIAILVLEETNDSLRVLTHNRRPRAAFGALPEPQTKQAGSRRATHRWQLLSSNRSVIASGEIGARQSVEAPPYPELGVPAAHVERETRAFMLRVPHPAEGEWIEVETIAPSRAAAGKTLVARWP